MSIRIPSSSAAASSTAPTARYDPLDDYDQFSLDYMRYVEQYRRIQRSARRAVKRGSIMHTSYARHADYVVSRSLESFRRAYERYTEREFESADAAFQDRAREFMTGRFGDLVNRDNFEQFRDHVFETIEGDETHELRFLEALNDIVRYDGLKQQMYGQLVRARISVTEGLDTVVRQRQIATDQFITLARVLGDDPSANRHVLGLGGNGGRRARRRDDRARTPYAHAIVEH
jgi:hypothetical protein